MFPGEEARVAASLLLGAVAAVVLLRRPGDRASTVFAYLLVCIALVTVPRGLLLDLAGFDGMQAWVRASIYPSIAIPFLMVGFAALYPRPRTWFGRSRLGPLALLGVAAVFMAGYALDAGWWSARVADPATGNLVTVFGPVAWVLPLRTPVAMGVAALLVRDYVRAPPGPSRSSLLLVAVGFAMLPLFYATEIALGLLLGERSFWATASVQAGPLSTAENVVWPLALVPFALLASTLARLARGADPAMRPASRAALAVLATAPLAAAASTALDALGIGTPLVGFTFLTSLFTLALPIPAAYALLRHRIFDIDLKVKVAIRRGTLVAGFAGAAFVGSEVLRSYAPGAGPVVGATVAAGIMVLLLARLQRVADKVAEAALPRVEESEAYLSQRKLDVYRAALEQAVQEDGTVAPREAAMLATLRAQLGLTDRDHALLAYGVRGGLGAGAPGFALAPGELLLGRYRVERMLGEGAHGVTALARDEALARPVVLKALRPEKDEPQALAEARAIGSIGHPNVVTVFDVERVGDRALIVMEHLDGGSLGDRVAKGPLAPAEFRRVAGDLLAALEAVHARGIVHRDVKPSNVLLTREGQAKLADFGVAHQPGLETTVGGSAAPVGTVRFMSPEAAKGRRVTPRSDLFSAGATLWEAYSGEPLLAPLAGESAVELQMRAARAKPFQAPARMPRELARWFATALHPDPARRFASGAEMRAALEQALGPEGRARAG